MAKKTYIVVSPLNHDGKDYAPGDTVDLDIKPTDDLIRRGIVYMEGKEPVPENVAQPTPVVVTNKDAPKFTPLEG